MTGTLSFNTKPNRDKVYNYLRNCSILSEKRARGRGDHLLIIHIPTNRTWTGMVQSLAAQGFSFVNYGTD